MEKRIIRKIEFERYLNDQPFPESVLKTNGGKAVPRRTTGYGSWLKRCEPDEFNKLYAKFVEENGAISTDVKDSSTWIRISRHDYGGDTVNG